MKKFCLFLFAAIAGAMCAGCDDDRNDYPSQWAFATVCPLENNDYYFVLDNGKSLYPGDKSRIGAFQAKADARAVVYFTLLKQPAPGYDYNAELYAIQDVYVGSTLIVDSSSETEGLPDDKISFFGARFSTGYLNLSVGFDATDLEKHSFKLIYDSEAEIDAENRREGYLNVELRHDADGDITGRDYSNLFVSFPLNDDFKALLAGKQGIILRVNTRLNGVKYIQIDREGEK